MRRVEALQVTAFFDHRRGDRAIDDVDFVALCLILREHFLHQPLGVAAEIFHLEKRIFLFKRLFDRSHDLIDDQRGIP